jgi:phosphotransferase system HPr-like phosphotransfer protein
LIESVIIKLNSLQELKRFVADCSKMNIELEVAAGEHTANAKSMLGLMTLPLSEPLTLRFQGEPQIRAAVLENLNPYRI